MMLDDFILADSESASASLVSASSTLALSLSALAFLASALLTLALVLLSSETHLQKSSILSIDSLFDDELDVSNDSSNPLELVHGLTFPN
ncbi:hypothetical protein F8M41_024978 [Gigaspora margarita]|uniref:Transmembrane protein n=1 Tax=Gigaspora margarita TaxID=4874 RepID=A0A8H3XL34_GIGMA|nr:hypothetical protein F8M41_024978 [Gigaspora margarita]